MPITYLKGDATSPQSKGPKIICHICNDIGRWGKGFVLAVSKRWPEPEADFKAWHAEGGAVLGAVRLVPVAPNLWVANLIGQRGIKTGSKGPPIRYEAVAAGLAQVGEMARELGASVHMPRIGCGLAGGEWSRIEPLIEEHLAGIEVKVYDWDG